MRNKTVEIAGKQIRVQERRIGELEDLVADFFPESGGDLSKVELGKILEDIGFDLLYDRLPVIFPELTAEDVKNAYMSEIEALVEAFISVNFHGLRRILTPLLSMAQVGLAQK